jgi:hypothetical protein
MPKPNCSRSAKSANLEVHGSSIAAVLISRTALRESSGRTLIGISESGCFFNDYEDLC